MADVSRAIRQAMRSAGALCRAVIFVLKLFPMLPSRPVDWITPRPVVEKVSYPRGEGEAEAEGDLYRPAGKGPFPGMVVCLGVVPFGVDHPQVPVLGRALARAGFAALLYWSPHMRDFRLDPEDIGNLARAYRWLVDRPEVDASRSGLLGTCVGGSFALMAAADPAVRDRISFVAAYAPFGSMATFAQDIASATRWDAGQRKPWQVDQLTRHVFVQSLTADLEPVEADRLRSAYTVSAAAPEMQDLSLAAQRVQAVLAAKGEPEAQAALRELPPAMHRRLDQLSPVRYLQDVHAPVVVLLHDEGDQVVPISESRQIQAALADRPGLHYTVMHFSHLDPAKGRLPLPKLLGEFINFFRGILPLFARSTQAIRVE
jgi:dienelactone hydrolase